MDLRLAIFDLDGVIVDTAKYHFLAWKRLSDELGINFTQRDNERLKGVSRMRSLDILLEIGGQEKTEGEKIELAARKNNWYLQSILKMDSGDILPGVVDFMEDLRKHNFKVALGSASKNARTILNQVGLEDYFDVIVDGNAVSKAKPDPEVFLIGAQKLEIHPQQAMVFEDAEAGIEAALHGGMIAIGVGDPKILKEAHLVIPDFKDTNLAQLLADLAVKSNS